MAAMPAATVLSHQASSSRKAITPAFTSRSISTRGKTRLAQQLGIVLAHTRRLTTNARAAPVGAELDRQSRQSGHLAPWFAKPRDEDIDQPAGRQQMLVTKQIARLPDRCPGHVG